jgi:hypothetical protein
VNHGDDWLEEPTDLWPALTLLLMPNTKRELEAAIPYYDLRHLVKQVLYPYGASVEDAREKLQYDLYYIKNYSVLLDLVILIRTLRVVLVGRGR